MMARWHESLFPLLEDLGIGYMAFSPLANGLLSEQYQAGCSFDKTTDYRAGMPQFKKESFETNKKLFALVDGLADKYRATPAQPISIYPKKKLPLSTRRLQRCP